MPSESPVCGRACSVTRKVRLSPWYPASLAHRWRLPFLEPFLRSAITKALCLVVSSLNAGASSEIAGMVFMPLFVIQTGTEIKLRSKISQHPRNFSLDVSVGRSPTVYRHCNRWNVDRRPEQNQRLRSFCRHTESSNFGDARALPTFAHPS
jgi:hypothetical protein